MLPSERYRASLAAEAKSRWLRDGAFCALFGATGGLIVVASTGWSAPVCTTVGAAVGFVLGALFGTRSLHLFTALF